MSIPFDTIVSFIKSLYPGRNPVPLHAPVFNGNEKKYLNDCIDSTYVSYVGNYVVQFENMVQDYTGARHAIATANGTVALQIALVATGVKKDDEVITQALTFVGTANAIVHAGAVPVFVDSDRATLGMSAASLEAFLINNTVANDSGRCINKITRKRIAACVPVNVFGHAVDIIAIKQICEKHHIELIEDAAEAMGSFYQNKHLGTFGKAGILSFNGNKIITTGGGGMVITDDDTLAAKIKHLTTTAKVPHPWEFVHDEIGYNYRMPNVNAAIGCAQMEQLAGFLKFKRALAMQYQPFFEKNKINSIVEPAGCCSNYWLNAIVFNERHERDEFLKYSNENGVMTRPVWRLMNRLPMFAGCVCGDLTNAEWLEERVVNIPSSVVV